MNENAKQSQKDLKSPHHRSYLLRLWCANESRDFNWQASLEIPATGERLGFASLEELFAYLMDLSTTHSV